LGSTRYRINSPHVVAETLDGEATIVDLESGTYYALNPSGSFIWDGLTGGREPAAVAGEFAAAYELDGTHATQAVDELLTQLTEQKLIVPAGNAAANGGAAANGHAAPARAASPNGGTYLAPELRTYTDMQELLLLDPIHEVDESGWPSQA
jgi:hypothetical protein